MLPMIALLILLSLPSASLLQLIAGWAAGRPPEFKQCFAAVITADILAAVFALIMWLLMASAAWLPIVLVILLSVVVYGPLLGISGPQGAISAALHRFVEALVIGGFFILLL